MKPDVLTSSPSQTLQTWQLERNSGMGHYSCSKDHVAAMEEVQSHVMMSLMVVVRGAVRCQQQQTGL